LKGENNKRKSAAYKRVRRRNLAFGILILLVLAILCLFTPVFSVSHITVVGNKILSEKDIITASGIDKGDNFIFLNASKCEKAINSLGYVDEVRVKRKFFTRIEIEVKEAKEVAYVTFSGKYVGIDISGKVLSIRKSSKFKPKKAVISGLGIVSVKKGDTIEPKSPQKYKIVIQLMELLNTKEILSRTAKIDIADKNKISVFLDSGTEIYFGDSSELDYKMEYAGIILENQPNVQKGLIDISNTSNVIYHPEEGGTEK